MERALICLLVEDDDDDQEFFKYALKKVEAPVELTIADDGAHALQTLQDTGFKPDIIFMDINMPRMNGIECIIELKKKSPAGRYPALRILHCARIPEPC